MHNWNDKTIDWTGLDMAAYYIGSTLRKYGRIRVSDYKEKWGTVRVYCSFGLFDLHCVVYPGYAYTQKQWMTKIRVDWINFIAVPLQTSLYRLIYKRAVKKWPHLRKEILSDADWPEYLKNI